jgi:polysaccharide pyruvyl transferase WcaK-like protein
MRIHHYYPRTRNIGDHFVARGIETMVRQIRPEAVFQSFDINSRGRDRTGYGLTRPNIERANAEAELIIVGGSNLYEGSIGWPWGIHLDLDALNSLRVPLFLVGIGTGSSLNSPLHVPSKRALEEIKVLNDVARFSGARDVVTLEWLHQLGVSTARLSGDPATFIFNRPFSARPDGHVLIVVPPRRFWSNKRQFLTVRAHGRGMFRALASLAQRLKAENRKLIVVCNDPLDLPVARKLFADVILPGSIEEYFALIADASAVVGGRLHSAVAAFSLGVPFWLYDVDQRTHGFLRTYELEQWSISTTDADIEGKTIEQACRLFDPALFASWEGFVHKREEMFAKSMDLLRNAFQKIS